MKSHKTPNLIWRKFLKDAKTELGDFGTPNPTGAHFLLFANKFKYHYHYHHQHHHYHNACLRHSIRIHIGVQESWATAKMTARCALYMGALKIFQNPWVRPRLLFPKFLINGLLFRSILWMCVHNLKFVTLPIPAIIGDTLKIRQSLDTSTLPFLPNSSWAFVRMNSVNVSANFAVRGFTRSRDNSDYSFELGLRIPNLGEGEAAESRGWYRSKQRWWVAIGFHSNFSSIFTHFRDIAAFVLQHPLFPTHL